MKQINLIKISKFQIEPNGGLLLISKTDGLPFLEVNQKGVTFDAGPFTGAFCNLEGLSKFFITKSESEDVFSVQLKFAEGDVYSMGGVQFSDVEQYNKALDWIITANKKIAQKKGYKENYSSATIHTVIKMLATCLEADRKLLKLDTLIKDITDSFGWEELSLEVEERFPTIVLRDIAERIITIGDLIDSVNAQVENVNAQVKNKTNFLENSRRKVRNAYKMRNGDTAHKLLQ